MAREFSLVQIGRDRRFRPPVAAELIAPRQDISQENPPEAGMSDKSISSGSGTAADPWQLKTPPLSSDYTMHRDTRDGVDVIVCTVGKTVLLYDARCLDDLHAMLV